MTTTTDNLNLSYIDKMEILEWAMSNLRLSHQVTIAKVLKRKCITWLELDKVFARLLDMKVSAMDKVLQGAVSLAKKVTSSVRTVTRYIIPVMSSLNIMTDYLTKVLARHTHRTIHSIKYLPNQWVVQFS